MIELKIPCVKIKDINTGTYYDLPAIKGKSAYDQAVEGGYTGTLEQFEEDLANAAEYDADARAALQETIDAKDTAVAAIGTAKTGAITDIGTAKTSAIADVNTAKTTAIGAVNTATTEGTAAINTAKTTAVSQANTEIQAKGDEVIASIPESYDELVDKVDESIIVGDESEITDNTKLYVSTEATEVEIPTLAELNEVKEDLDGKVDKSAIGNAGLTSDIEWTTLIDTTSVTTVEDIYKSQRIEGINTLYWSFISSSDERLLKNKMYKVTYNGVSYNELCTKYGYIKDIEDSSGQVKGSTVYNILGNKYLYDSRYENSGEPFCIIYNEHGENVIPANHPNYFTSTLGYILLTDSEKNVSIKLERSIPTYNKLPVYLSSNYGVSDEIFEPYNGMKSSYPRTSIGHGNIVGRNSFAIGSCAVSTGWRSVAEVSGMATGNYSHAAGCMTTASGVASHAEGTGTTASGVVSHAEGQSTEASGKCSHAEGYGSKASGHSSHAEGYGTEASGECSYAEGYGTKASGKRAHAEGGNTVASGNSSHAEGYQTKATNYEAHAEGYLTEANGEDSHVGGFQSIANGNQSFAHGFYAKSTQPSQFAIGYGNNPQTDSIFEVGNGLNASGQPNISGSAEPVTRQNAFRVTQDGKAIAQTALQIGNTAITEEQLISLLTLLN